MDAPTIGMSGVRYLESTSRLSLHPSALSTKYAHESRSPPHPNAHMC